MTPRQEAKRLAHELLSLIVLIDDEGASDAKIAHVRALAEQLYVAVAHVAEQEP